MTLRPYQQRLVDASIAHMLRDTSPFVVEAATGAGKSHVIAEVAALIHAHTGKRILCLAPSAELVVQNRGKFTATGAKASTFSASAGAKDLRHPVVFGSPMTVRNKISRFMRPGNDGYALAIVDECFSAGTMIETPHGAKPIESLRNGDIVCNVVGSGQVETVFTKAVSELYRVRLSNGTTIECTGNHPFFTMRGWIDAASLLEGEIAFCNKDVSRLLSRFCTENGSAERATQAECPIGKELEQTSHLFSILREEMEEPHAQRFVTAKDAGNTEAHRAQTASGWGQWARPDGSTTSTSRHIGRWMDCGASDSNRKGPQERCLPERIQGRPSLSGGNDRSGSGWGEPRNFGETSRGQKEGCAFGSIRVESVSRVQLTCPEIVYNLHVSGHPSYFAGGVLVHNCHGLTPTVKGILASMQQGNPNLRIMGLTATPYRMGSGYIYREEPDGHIHGEDRAREPYFDRCVGRVEARELIGQGYLTTPVIGQINSEGYDTAGLTLNSRRQFDAGAVDRAYHGHGRKTAAIVADVVTQSRERCGVMFFAATVQHAREVLASLPPEMSAIVTAETPQAERRTILEAFKAQRIKYIVNVSVLTVGFNAPHVDVIAILRKTESVGLLQQIIGRGLRICDGKVDCLVLDYTSNLEEHCPDGDLFAPIIRTGKAPGVPGGLDCECPECGYENNFTLQAQVVEAGYKIDKYGYCLDLDGAPVMTDYGPMPAHFGRRCMGQVKIPGTPRTARQQYERCGYRWTGKDCPHCGEKNDIAARYCYICKGEIVDPNEKLAAGFRAMKRDPTQRQTDRVLDFKMIEGVSARGNKTIRADYVTAHRSFSIWYQPEATHTRGQAEWEVFRAAVMAGLKTLTYQKDSESRFYRAIAYNWPEDKVPTGVDQKGFFDATA